MKINLEKNKLKIKQNEKKTIDIQPVFFVGLKMKQMMKSRASFFCDKTEDLIRGDSNFMIIPVSFVMNFSLSLLK